MFYWLFRMLLQERPHPVDDDFHFLSVDLVKNVLHAMLEISDGISANLAEMETELPGRPAGERTSVWRVVV